MCIGGARWNVGVMWNSGRAIWYELRCDVKYGVMTVYVKCGADGECWNFRHVATEMQNVRCGTWRGVECGVLVCGMLHNARFGKSRCDVKCGGVELWWWRMWHMQCAVRLLRVRCGKWCKMFWCHMWWCYVKSRCGGVMRCRLCCGVKYAVMLNVGVEWCEMWCGCVMWNMSALICGGVKWWCRGRPQCNVISDIEYGGPRWDVLQH